MRRKQYTDILCYYDPDSFCKQDVPCKNCSMNPNSPRCPICGAHLGNWREVFNEVHYCDPSWFAREAEEKRLLEVK